MDPLMKKIELDFQNAVNQKNRVSECAEQVRNVERELQNIMAELNRGWKGDAANAYLAKCDALNSKLANTDKNLDKIADTIYKTAKAYKVAEETAIAIARNRTF